MKTKQLSKQSSFRRNAMATAGVCAILGLCLASPPARAAYQDFQKIVDNYVLGADEWKAFIQAYIDDLGVPTKTYLVDDLVTLLQEQQPDFMGPDTIQTREDTRQKVLSDPNLQDSFGAESTTAAELAAREVVRQHTDIQVQSVIGADAQKATQAAIEATEKNIENISDTATEAQTMVVTQDIMKSLVSLQAEQSEMIGQMRVDQMRSRVDTQYTNLNLANISRSLDEMQRLKLAEAPAEGNSLLRFASLAAGGSLQ
jgi:hypothetical protein